jgi:hypothetical protein
VNELGNRLGNRFGDEFGDELEEQWRVELRPVLPPEGFADRIVTNVSQMRRKRARRAFVLWVAIFFVTAGSLAAILKQYEQKRQEQAATQKFVLAMRVTGRTLSLIEERTSRAAIRAKIKTNEVER